MTPPPSPQRPLRWFEWLFRGIVFLVAITTGLATRFAIAQKTAFLESFPGASESIYYFFLIGGVIGFVALVGLFYFQQWATWIFGILALFVTIVNFGVSAPLLHTFAGIALTLVILFLGYFCRERFRA
jgi:hypothetical protein